MVYNDYLEEDNAKIKEKQWKEGPNIHELVSLPQYKNFNGTI